MPAFDFSLPAVAPGTVARQTWQALKDAQPLDLTGYVVTQRFYRRASDSAPAFLLDNAQVGGIALLDPTAGQFQATLGADALAAFDVPTALLWRITAQNGGEPVELGSGYLPYGAGSENPTIPAPPASGYALSLLLPDAAPSESSVTAASAVINTPTGLLAALANLLGGGVERNGGFAGSAVAGQLAADIAADAGWIVSGGRVIRVQTTATRRVTSLPANATTTLYLHADGTITATQGADGLAVQAVTTNGTQATGFSAPAPALSALLTRAGGSLLGALTLAADPAVPLGAATKQYVDAGDAAAGTAAAQKSANLSDLQSAPTALGNLGGASLAGADFTGAVRFGGGKPWYDVTLHGVDATGATDITTALAALQVTAGASGVLYFPAGSYKITGAGPPLAFTFTSPVVMAPGAVINPDSGTVVTFNGTFRGPGLMKCLGVVGSSSFGVRFGVNTTEEIYPQWWGALANGINNDTLPITSAYAAAPAAQGIVLPAGTYFCNSSLGVITKPTRFLPGAIISPTTGNSPTYQGPILAHPTQQIFALNTNIAFTANKGNPLVSVKWFGAVGDGVTDDTTAITKASFLTGAGNNIYFPPGTYVVNSSVAFAANVVLEAGAILKPAAARTLTLNGELRASRNRQIFDCTAGSGAKIVFGSQVAGEVPLKWWGVAIDDGTTGTATANAAAINTALLSGASDYYLGAGEFGITVITVPSNVRIYGAGKFLTSLRQRTQQVVFNGTGVSNATIEKLAVNGTGLSGNYTSSTCHVNFSGGCDNILIRDCWFHDTAIISGQRTFILQFTDAGNVEVEHCLFSDIGGCGCYYHNSSGTNIGSFRFRFNRAFSRVSSIAPAVGDSWVQAQSILGAVGTQNADIDISHNIGVNVATNPTDPVNTQAAIDVYSEAHRVIVAHNAIDGCGAFLSGSGLSQRDLAAIRVSSVQECAVDANMVRCWDVNAAIQVFCRGTYNAPQPAVNSSVTNNKVRVAAGGSGGTQASVNAGFLIGNTGSPALSMTLSDNSIVGDTPTVGVNVGFDLFGDKIVGSNNQASGCKLGQFLIIEDGSQNIALDQMLGVCDPANPQSTGSGVQVVCNADTPAATLVISAGPPSSGTLTFTGRHPLTGVPVSTAALPYNVSPAALQTALEAIYGAGNVTVGGSVNNWTFSWPGWSTFPIFPLQVDGSTLAGGTGQILVTLLPSAAGLGRIRLSKIVVEGFASGIVMTRVRNATLEGCAVRRCQYGIYLTEVIRSQIRGNSVVGITGLDSGGAPLPNTWGYRLQSCSDLNLEGNYGEGAGNDGMNLNACADCRISGGELREANQAGSTGVLLNLVGCSNVGVSGVLMRAGSNANKPVSAIKVDNTSTGIDLSDGCDIQGTYASGAYALSGSGFLLPKPGAPSVLPGALSTRTITAAVKLADTRGNPLARREAVRVWLADSQFGAESGTVPDGGSTIGGSGVTLRTLAASLDWEVLPASDGSFTVAVTHSASRTYWLHVQDGSQIATAQLVFT